MKQSKKIVSVIMIFTTFLFSLLIYLPTGNAEETIEATITANEVRFRSGPGTNYSSLGYLNQGYTVSLKSTNVTNGTGCSSGWYNIYYNGKNGYVCASYVNVPGIGVLDELGRPWTSPKKAIIGGAKFIARDYISKGQNTSYLKKFNVNPNGYYNVYDHQYMANLQAPNSEAYTSYKSYQKNNLLSLSLHFIIPLFENMPEYTTHPMYGKEEGGTSIVTDQTFENELNKEGFDETYKKWLRELHKKYPNWTFESLKTGLDFNYSVEREKWASSIQKSSCAKCIDSSNTNTEGNWYVANSETTAYYLDPRNFLMEDSILMFEDLGNSSHYTEDIVKSILAGTFMSGKDNVDNISYSSMFMEAGSIANISPVYLASLSRQEVGINKGLVTSGEKIEYKGITYIGFYNFYNIGAYSSEENPAKAGIVFAATGATKKEDGSYVGNFGGSEDPDNNENNSEPTATPVSTHISRMGLNKKGNYLTNLSLNSTVGNLSSKTTSSELTFKNASGNQVGNTERLGTGMSVTFKTGEVMSIVIYGDLTGDGAINSADLLRMRQHLLGQATLNGAYLESAHLATTSGAINSADLLRLRQYLLGQKGINQA